MNEKGKTVKKRYGGRQDLHAPLLLLGFSGARDDVGKNATGVCASPDTWTNQCSWAYASGQVARTDSPSHHLHAIDSILHWTGLEARGDTITLFPFLRFPTPHPSAVFPRAQHRVHTYTTFPFPLPLPGPSLKFVITQF